MTKSDSKPKFTPGPWCTAMELLAIKPDAYAYVSSHVYTRNGEMIAACCSCTLNRCNQDAALIAAAPEMYEMLERLGHALFAENADEWAEEINAMLAKARGEEFQKNPPKT